VSSSESILSFSLYYIVYCLILDFLKLIYLFEVGTSYITRVGFELVGSSSLSHLDLWALGLQAGARCNLYEEDTRTCACICIENILSYVYIKTNLFICISPTISLVFWEQLKNLKGKDIIKKKMSEFFHWDANFLEMSNVGEGKTGAWIQSLAVTEINASSFFFFRYFSNKVSCFLPRPGLGSWSF
jgi:hypothetical protein